MELAGGERPTIVIGGKGSSLSSADVYAVARGFRKVTIDPAALERLSRSQSPPPHQAAVESISKFLASDESRAALVVLINKLVVSEAAVRPTFPSLIGEILGLQSGHSSLDFGSSGGLVTSLFKLNGKHPDEFVGATKDEISVLEKSAAASVGICAMLDCCASALVKLSDAVAAFSCEAARADVGLFDLPSSGDGFSIKDETDVAADIKAFLFGSKTVGQLNSGPFSDIPAVHGSFRGAVRALHGRIRVELNSSINVRKNAVGVVSHVKEKALVALVLPLAMSIQSMCELSLGRAMTVATSLGNEEKRKKFMEDFEKRCPSLDVMREGLCLVSEKAASGSDSVEVLHGVYELLVILKEILAWEAAAALYALELDSSIEKPEVNDPACINVNSENEKVEKKGEKKKRKKTLGRGTSILWKVFKDMLSSQNDASIDNVATFGHWAELLARYFDPEETRLDTLLGKIKEIVESNEVRRLPKIPKGTRDFGKEQMAIREHAFSVITGVFKRHGAVSLDTPVFELRETLMGKYGEDSKLIYDLADQGGELCSLRYDLTVPFARYLAMNNINSLKRYQIAKVYRRDNPSKGRYREFYQCDLDVAGQCEVMEADFEVLKVLTELLDELNIGDYEIKLNHRKLLDGMLEICGVSSEKFRTVCSSIDKLDKQSFEQVKKELVEEKGLAVETAEKIGTFVKKRGPPLEILSELKGSGSSFLGNRGSVLALNELEILFNALEKSKCLEKIVFDLSLARGLDYYTGAIFEAVFKGSTQVGSIAAGGRYDNLVGMFSGKQVPAVGVSLGIERVFTIMEQLEKEKNKVLRATETQVLVAILGKDLLLAAELVSELWNVKVKAEFGLNKRVRNHIDRAVESGIPWVVFVGESELNSGILKLKNIESHQEEIIPRERFAEELQKRLNMV
ncbi:hypothetical protein M5K25_014875 [Dendrobium thyrsiflorum]|uniref:Histidine--tRNA ligase, cytoplasmic n=1 Tax=Dendrobium thyrsiflorum TaxID=117978 RepID=A0ABD0UNY7_DENTH